MIFSWRAWFVCTVTGKLTTSPRPLQVSGQYTDFCLIRHIQRFAPTSRSVIRPDDAAICLDLLSKGIANLRNRSLSKFQIMFSTLREKVYASKYAFGSASQGISFSQTTETPISPGAPDIMGGRGDTEYVPDTDGDIMLLSSEVLEGYLSQMSTIFDNEMRDIDDTLTAWYGSVLNDIGDIENMRMR